MFLTLFCVCFPAKVKFTKAPTLWLRTTNLFLLSISEHSGCARQRGYTEGRQSALRSSHWPSVVSTLEVCFLGYRAGISPNSRPCQMCSEMRTDQGAKAICFVSILINGDYSDLGFLTCKEMALKRRQFAPQGTFGNFWRYFWLSQLSGELLASSR